jgi:replication-associated recombination protein RarA
MGGGYMAATIDTSSSKARKSVNMNKSVSRIATPKTDKIEEIIDRAHSYEIYEEGIGRYRFVGRVNEIRKILESSEYLFLGGRITVLYGSKGCGKSTLFKAISHAVKGSDFEAILIETVSDAERKDENIDKNKKIFIVADEVRIDSPRASEQLQTMA